MQYEKMTITQLESAVRKALTEYKCGIIEAAKVLRYLQETNRYKENVRYSKEQFKVYIDDQFGVRMGTYMDWIRALLYEKEAETYGVGLVSKTIKICGKKGAVRAFTEIATLEEVQKKRVPREKIDDIIAKHTDPKRKAIKKTHNDWKTQYMAEVKMHEETKRQLKVAQGIIAEQIEQIRKLKVSAEIMLAVKRAMGELVEA